MVDLKPRNTVGKETHKFSPPQVVDTDPARLVSMVDWSYLGDVVSEERAVEILTVGEEEKQHRIR